jgi:hypothetical protein
MLLGALHIHSTYSDGEFSLRELRDVLGSAGCRFACVTDHADHFDAASLGAYVAECEALSDDQFRFIPGLEYPCENRLHIAGYGATVPIDSTDPATVIRHIAASGGIAVIAHPKDVWFDWIASLDEVPHGLEVWNSKYDGRYAPRASTFALLARLQHRRPDCRAFYGLDLHWRTQYRGLLVEVEAASVRPVDVLAALAKGAFAGVKDQMRLPSNGAVDMAWLARGQRTRGLSHGARQVLGSIKRVLDRAGIRVPASLKAQARRAF